MKGQKASLFLACFALALTPLGGAHLYAIGAAGHRTTISLNGQWDVDDSISPDVMPREYTHKAPVPGLTHSAVPAFRDVDQFQSRETGCARVSCGSPLSMRQATRSPGRKFHLR
jgi:hypothetical protein